jgi:hypothetical protein
MAFLVIKAFEKIIKTKTTDYMKLKKILTMPIGILLIAVAVFMEKFLPGNDTLDFVIGLLIGLSMVLNICFIFLIVKKRRSCFHQII